MNPEGARICEGIAPSIGGGALERATYFLGDVSSGLTRAFALLVLEAFCLSVVTTEGPARLLGEFVWLPTWSC